jgi:translocon-associated protein subunit beta
MKWVHALAGDEFCSTAYDVSLTDDTWPSALFSLVSGNTSRTWEKLEV